MQGRAWGQCGHTPHTHLVLDVERETRERNSEEASRGPPGPPERGHLCLTVNAVLSSEVRRWQRPVTASLTSDLGGGLLSGSSRRF